MPATDSRKTIPATRARTTPGAWRRSLVAGTAMALLLSGLMAASAASDEQHLRPPEHVPPDTRAELSSRMGRHGETMSSLVRSVVLLDRGRVRVLAGRIAEEEIIAKTIGGAGGRKPLALPREFAAEQARLVTTARELAIAAAEGSEDRVLAERFAAVTSTCVSCHSIYVHGWPDLRPFGAGSR